MPTGGDGDDDDGAVTLDDDVHNDHMAHPASTIDEDVFLFLFPPPQQFCGSLDEDGDGAGPLVDDEGRDGHLVLPASAVEGLTIVAGGKEDGNQFLLLLSLQRERN